MEGDGEGREEARGGSVAQEARVGAEEARGV